MQVDPLLTFLPEETPTSVAPSSPPIQGSPVAPPMPVRSVSRAIGPLDWLPARPRRTPRTRRADSRLAGKTTQLAFASGLTLGMFSIWLVLSPPRSNNAEPEYQSAPSEHIETARDEPASSIAPLDAAPQVTTRPTQQAAATANTPVASTVVMQTAPILRQSSQRPVRRQLGASPSTAPDVLTVPTSRATQFLGSLAVSSDPEGAQVSVNGLPVGTTPLVLRDLPVGSRVVRVHRDGYQPWSSVVRVVADERTNVTAPLAPSGGP